MYRPYGMKHPDANNRMVYDSPLVKDCEPLQFPSGRIPVGEHAVKPVEALNSGDFAVWQFDATVPDTYTPAMNFYVMGHAIYRDPLKGSHVTVFARHYDPNTNQFEREQNPSYDGNE